MAEQAGELAMRGGARGDFRQGAIDLRAVGIDGPAAMERDRQIVGSDEHAVDSRRRQDRVERGERFAGFDHRDRQGHGVGPVQIGGTDEAAERLGGARPPRALAERRELHMLGEAARRRSVVDHRRDDRRRAGVDEPAGEREIADRDARDRRLAGKRDGEDRLRGADEIDAAVLQVERHRVEALARQGFGDRGVVDADPGGERAAPLRQSMRQFADHAAVAHRRFPVHARALVGQARRRVNRPARRAGEFLVT